MVEIKHTDSRDIDASQDCCHDPL